MGAITTWALLAVMFAVRGESLIREVRDFRSSNQKFIARVARVNEGLGPARMTVFKVTPKGTNTIWQVTPLHGDRGGVPSRS